MILSVAELKNSDLRMGGVQVKSQYAPPSKSLYRFFSSDTDYFRDTIEHLVCKNEIYLSSRQTFNDPYDMNPLLKSDWTTHAIREHMKAIAANPSRSSAEFELVTAFLRTGGTAPREALSTQNIRRLKESFPKYMLGLLNKIGVCCFTEEMQNPLFWAHYAHKYTGVCIELLATADSTHPFYNCTKVHYSEHRPVIFASQTGAFGTVYKDSDWDYIAQFGLCTKSIDWSVEKEWRFWLPNQANKYQSLPPRTLRSIFLGPLADDKTKDFVIRTAKSTAGDLKVFNTALSKTDFRVIISRRIF
ncbi:MAG: DUF2971 domain-containing protein [Chthoniobacterales bacterium]